MKRAAGYHVGQRVPLFLVFLILGCQLRLQFQPEDLAHASHTRAAHMTKALQEHIKIGDDSPTDEELYAWTMRREAIASCLIEDVFHLRPNSAKSEFLG